MKKLTSKAVVRLLREEYEAQLNRQLHEVDLFDSRGTLIISKDLKVIHKPSGFVYTVKGVTGEPGSAKVVLRNPEEPRVEPAQPASPAPAPAARLPNPELATEDVVPDEEKEKKEDKRDWGKRAHPPELKRPKEDAGETMFVIDQREFEKHYEEA